MAQFYYLLMSKLEIFKNNVIEEVLRERANYYFSKNRANDFWLIESPEFIQSQSILKKIEKLNFFEKNQNSEYFVIISSDKVFINWLALRIGYFEALTTSEKNSKSIPYTINGIKGNIQYGRYSNVFVSSK